MLTGLPYTLTPREQRMQTRLRFRDVQERAQKEARLQRQRQLKKLLKPIKQDKDAKIQRHWINCLDFRNSGFTNFTAEYLFGMEQETLIEAFEEASKRVGELRGKIDYTSFHSDEIPNSLVSMRGIAHELFEVAIPTQTFWRRLLDSVMDIHDSNSDALRMLLHECELLDRPF